MLRDWAAAKPGKVATGFTAKQEMAAIYDGMLRCDHEFWEQWAGWHPARRRYLELEKLPEGNIAPGVSIDDYLTYHATRFADPV